ncbi:MAG: sugar ABC transporter substrate-binding protein [Steroidobacteraceae bacterium]|nr:sugar ABC transporter substrate-binding protein [Steroidobacteraceae bacterium]
MNASIQDLPRSRPARAPRRGLALLAGVLALLAPGAASADAAADGIAHAARQIEKHRAKPVFVAPGAPFDAQKCAAGRKMLSVPNSSANPFLKGIIKREVEVGKQLGLTVQEWQNQGQPSQWAQGVEFAVRNKFDIVNLISGVDPKTLEPQIRAARAAGVKTMTSHFYDPSQPQNPLVAASLPVGFNAIGKLLADWAILRSNGNAQIVVIKSSEVPPTEPLMRGLRDELAAHCPKCRIVNEVNVGVTEWATKIQSSLQSALLANPGVNWVIPIYDSMSQFVVPAIQITGRKGKVKVATFNGTPFVLDYVRNGDVDMNIGESLDWIAHATIDGYLRALCGLPVPKDIGVPFYLFDAGNVKDAGVPAKFDQGYGSDYVAGFRRLWGLAK